MSFNDCTNGGNDEHGEDSPVMHKENDRQNTTSQKRRKNSDAVQFRNEQVPITCTIMESATVAINVSVRLEEPLIDPNQFRVSEFKNIYRRMISINDDPDLQTLIVPQCGLTCVDLKELERGVKVAHLEKLFPYLEKHIDTSHQYSCQNNENDTENDNKSCKSITRRELKRMVKSLGKDENGVLSMEEFCEFLSKLDDCVQDKCEDPNAVMKTWKELTHAGVYSCWPPPLFIPVAILLQVIMFVWHHYYYTYYFDGISSAPMCSKLALHPERRWQEPWRYLTYGLVHKDSSHMIKNIVGVGLAGMILEYYHSSWRVLLVYIAGIVVGAIGRINPVTRVTPLTPLVGSSGAVYALFGANIAHSILNWKEDVVIYRRSAHGQPLRPVSKKYARWGRAIRAMILGFWVLSEIGYAFHEKILKCKAWNISSDTEETLNDFDQCWANKLRNETRNNDDDEINRWWCKTETSYSAHIYGFLAGLFLGLCILQTPNLTKRKKILRFVSIFLFVVILGTGLYQNIYESLEKGIFSAECSLFDYEKMCQAKCYCGLRFANVSNSFYKNCQAYDICHVCGDGQKTTAKYCSYLQSNLQIG